MNKITRENSERIKKLLIAISPMVEHFTAAICPDCRDVCCKQRHGIMNDMDRGFVSALGEPFPREDPARPLDGPCQFMGSRGCNIPRWQRPWRCTSYFCEPLLDAMNRGPQKLSRSISGLIQEIVDIRCTWL
jgi:hypothetical protein